MNLILGAFLLLNYNSAIYSSLFLKSTEVVATASIISIWVDFGLQTKDCEIRAPLSIALLIASTLFFKQPGVLLVGSMITTNNFMYIKKYYDQNLSTVDKKIIKIF